MGGRLRSVGYMWGPSLLGSSYDQAAPLHLPVWGKRWAAGGCVLSAPLLSAGFLQDRSVLRYRPYTVSPSRITLRWGRACREAMLGGSFDELVFWRST